jgi:glycosyltransferase involved in cell wall biosynthesis
VRHSSAVRLALLHYTYPPVIGGVERVLAAHAHLFAAAGHQVTVFCSEGASSDPAIQVRHFPPSSAMRAFLAHEFADHDVVFVHNVCTMPFDPRLTDALGEVAASLPMVRFVCWIHDIRGDTGSLQKFMASRARLEYVAISEHRAQQFAALTGVMPRVVPNGIDISQTLQLDEAVSALVRDRCLMERDVVLLQPARVVARKRVDFSLAILRALRTAHCHAALLVTAAPDPHNPQLAAVISSLHGVCDGMQNDALFVNELLEVTDARLAQLYRIADAVLIPSADEGFALPILEAALHRVPVFCSDIAPLREHLLPVHTFSPDAEPGLVAQQISRTIAQSSDAQARKRVTRDFAWDTIYRNHLAPILLEAPTHSLS